MWALGVEIAAWAVRLLLAGVFLYAGLIKAGDREEFLNGLLPFTFMPPEWLVPISFVLPWAEVLTGVLLLLPWTVRWGAAASAALMFLFAGVIGWALSEGLVVACSCFGEDEIPSEEKMVFVIIRDLVLAAAALWLVFRKRS